MVRDVGSEKDTAAVGNEPTTSQLGGNRTDLCAITAAPKWNDRVKNISKEFFTSINSELLSRSDFYLRLFFTPKLPSLTQPLKEIIWVETWTANQSI